MLMKGLVNEYFSVGFAKTFGTERYTNFPLYLINTDTSTLDPNKYDEKHGGHSL